jgi:hypothetical protein
MRRPSQRIRRTPAKDEQRMPQAIDVSIDKIAPFVQGTEVLLPLGRGRIIECQQKLSAMDLQILHCKK